MQLDPKVFEDKTLTDLFKNIFDNHASQKSEISSLAKEFAKLIRRPDDVVMIGPILQELIDTSVKNDEQLIKMAGIVQRLAAAEMRSVSDTDNDIILSESERERLVKNATEKIINDAAVVGKAVQVIKEKKNETSS